MMGLSNSCGFSNAFKRWRFSLGKVPLFVRDDSSGIACHFERSEKSFSLSENAVTLN